MKPQETKTGRMIGDAFRHAVKELHIAPSEFWAMSPQDFALLLETSSRVSLSEEERAELLAYL